MVHGSVISSLILLMSIIMLYLAYKIISLLTKKLNLTNALFFFMLNYVIFAYIGSVIFNVWYTPSCIGYGIYDRKDFLLITWIITSLGLFAIPLCTAMIYKSLYFNSQSVINVWQKSLYRESPNENSIYYICWMLFCVCVCGLLIYLKKIEGAPIIRFFMNNDLSTVLLRSEATNNFSGKLWRYSLFYKEIPLALFILSCFFKKKNLRNVLFIYMIFVSIMNFEKAPVIQLILLCILIYYYLHKKISMKVILSIGVICVMLLIIMYFFFMGSKSIASAFLGMFQRIFTGQIDCFPWYFKYVETHGFLMGKSFPNPAGIFPFTHVRITVEVMNMYYESIGRVTEVVGSMPTVFMADWYVNFGYLGVVISIILFSFMIAFIDGILLTRLKNRQNIYLSALYVYLINYFSKYASTSFTGIVFDASLIISVLILVIIYFLSRINFRKLLVFSVN